MHRRALLMSAAGALVACSAPTQSEAWTQPSSSTSPSPPPPAEAFDVRLYRALAAEEGNQFVSPVSVACAFALLYPGARGETAAEIAVTFGFDASPLQQARRTRALVQSLTTQSGGSEFTTANAAWVEQSMRLRAEYGRLIHDELGAAIEAVDFLGDQRQALARINAWAARETRNRIPEILSTPNPDRRLVLTNAVYFKGKWSDPFSASATYEGSFFTASGTAEPARLMRQTTHARYFEEENFQAAEFDYDDGDFGLAVFLPRPRSQLGAIEGNLSGETLDAWLQRLADADRTRIAVTLPKVEMNADYELARQLQLLGIRRAFGDSADFSGITEQTGLAISAVVHKTFLAIDEEGTEAAAATAIDMAATAAPIPETPPIEFKADRPFFIVLRHKRSRARIFLGRIATMSRR